METFFFIALILLSLVGYSGGAVSRGARQADLKPAVADLVLILIIWAAAIYTRLTFDFNKWVLILFWVTVAVVVGIIFSTFRQLPKIDRLARHESEKASSTTFKRLWYRWHVFSRRMGSFQSRVWLSLFFFLVVSPFALAVKLLGDPLRIKTNHESSYWHPMEKTPRDIEEHRRQF